MKFKLAIYNSTKFHNNSYWQYHPAISSNILEDFYSLLVKNGDIDELNKIGKLPRSGCALLKNLGFVYRIFPLRTARLQSWVLAFVFDRKEAEKYDVMAVFNFVEKLLKEIDLSKNNDDEICKPIDFPSQIEYDINIPLLMKKSSSNYFVDSLKMTENISQHSELSFREFSGDLECLKLWISEYANTDYNFIISIRNNQEINNLHYILFDHKVLSRNTVLIRDKLQKQKKPLSSHISKNQNKIDYLKLIIVMFFFVLAAAFIFILKGFRSTDKKPQLNDKREKETRLLPIQLEQNKKILLPNK